MAQLFSTLRGYAAADGLIVAAVGFHIPLSSSDGALAVVLTLRRAARLDFGGYEGRLG